MGFNFDLNLETNFSKLNLHFFVSSFVWVRAERETLGDQVGRSGWTIRPVARTIGIRTCSIGFYTISVGSWGSGCSASIFGYQIDGVRFWAGVLLERTGRLEDWSWMKSCGLLLLNHQCVFYPRSNELTIRLDSARVAKGSRRTGHQTLAELKCAVIRLRTKMKRQMRSEKNDDVFNSCTDYLPDSGWPSCDSPTRWVLISSRGLRIDETSISDRYSRFLKSSVAIATVMFVIRAWMQLMLFCSKVIFVGLSLVTGGFSCWTTNNKKQQQKERI